MFNRKQLVILMTAATMGGAFVSANAATPATAPTANAVIQTPLSIVENTPMDFATIAPDGGGGTVTLDTADGIAPVVGFVLSGTPASGLFTVTGEGGLSYAISFGAGSFTLNKIAPVGPETLTLNNLQASGGLTHTITGLGTQTDTFKVGGDLLIGSGPAAAAGVYQGSYTVQVDYQ